MDKNTVGSEKKDTIFYIILRDFGPDAAVEAMNRLAKLSARYLTNQGFSLGIKDVFPSDNLTKYKQDLVLKSYQQCEVLIQKFQDGTLDKVTGCTAEQSLENLISGILSDIRKFAGDYCIENLSKWCTPLIMAKCGSKGSALNVAQMVAVVGQQIIGGERVPDGFQDRSLPHFPKNSRQPPSKGFVRNSFFTGLTPTEFLFHAISGREGLVDTAVKTAETGYMSRRLMKSLEDLSVQYDDTVRNSSNIVVQFQFGDDKLDPLDMEGDAKPVNFARTWNHAEALTWDNAHESLLPYEIKSHCKRLLAPRKAKLGRTGLMGDLLDYDDTAKESIDEKESARDFLMAITDHLGGLASKMASFRKKVGLSPSEEDPGASTQQQSTLKEKNPEQATVDRVVKVSLPTLEKFVELCLHKYEKAKVEPGHAVGAVGAQSIGEPGTQMTLKTFHHAGVAGISITQGVPRIKEIINASKVISTPVIVCPLQNKKSLTAAQVVKGRIEKTFVSDVIRYIEDMWSSKQATVCLAVNTQALNDMHLGIGVYNIANTIIQNKKLKIKANDVDVLDDKIFIKVLHGGSSVGRGGAKAKAVFEDGGSDLLLRVNHLKRALPLITISGYPDASRAIIYTDGTSLENQVQVEGYGLRACMSTEGVIGRLVYSNSVMETRDVLGIEAARKTIASEIQKVMGGMNIDPRHMQLLADVMTYKGEVLGITRFGLSKMRDSVLQLASFEKTPDHLFEAAAGMKTDKIEGVSESIIMGQTMSVGTGAFQVVRKLNLKADAAGIKVGRKPTAFESAWKWDQAQRAKEDVVMT